MEFLLMARVARPGVRLSRTISSLHNFSPISKDDATKIILGAKQKSSLTFKDLSDKLQVNKVWLVAAIHGQHPIDGELSNRLIQALNITGTSNELGSLVDALSQIPVNRAAASNDSDPVVRRLQELVDVYGQSIKAIIREEAGDGIMSAIDCTIDLDAVKKTEQEIRINLKVDGKFLPYKVKH